MSNNALKSLLEVNSYSNLLTPLTSFLKSTIIRVFVKMPPPGFEPGSPP